ncbi:MAG: hypothetical protein WCW33_04130 [Candidatus Babeliales bacterium]|jgi:hypothetical protein
MIDSYKKTGLAALIIALYVSSGIRPMPSVHYVLHNGNQPRTSHHSSDHQSVYVYPIDDQSVVGIRSVDGTNVHDNQGNHDKHRDDVTLVEMSPDDYNRVFQSDPGEYELLGDLSGFADHNFRTYARTLRCYGDFILWLNDKIQHDKKFRKETAYVPGFDYSFFLGKEKSEFHNFVRDEAKKIQDERAKIVLLAQKPRLRVADNTFLETIRTAPAHLDPETTQRYQQRADALKRTIASNGTCSDYSSHVPPVSADDKYTEAFSNTYGTPLDCQLHKELCCIRSEVSELECKYSHDAHVQIIAPVIHRFAARAKVEQSPTLAFGISDFCHDLTQVFTKGIHTLYHYSTAVGKRVVKGVHPVLTLEHWKGMAKGTLHMGLLFLDAVGQEDVRQDALLVAAFSKNYEVLYSIERNYCLQTKAQSEALHHLARTTYDKLKKKSWKELAGDGIELGTTMVLDTLALNAAGGFVSATSRAAVAELSGAFKQGLFTEQYATEVAGFGKLIVEEGADAAAIADSAILNDAALFQEASEVSVAQAVKNSLSPSKLVENITQKFQNNVDGLIKSADTLLPGNNTAVGRAFQKHCIREKTSFIGEVTGNAAKNTEQGMQYLNKILRSPEAVFTIRDTNAFGRVIDVRLPDGLGARWTVDGQKFIGFLEKYTPNP